MRKAKNMNSARLTVVCLFALLASGCATTGVLNPHYKTGYFDVDFSEPKTVLVMPVDIKGYKMTAGGVSEEIDEWEQEMKDNLENALRGKTAGGEKYRFVVLEEDDLSEEEKATLKDRQALYRALVASMANPVPTKKKEFVYTFGQSFDFLKRTHNADILMFVSGIAVQETFGKVMMNLLAAAAGYGITSEGCYAYYSLVDGDNSEVIWFQNAIYPSGGTFRNEKTTEKIVNGLTKKMPFGEKK